MTFTRSQNVAYNFFLFWCLKLKLIVVCREFNSASSYKKVSVACYFSNRIFLKEKMSQYFWYTRYIVLYDESTARIRLPTTKKTDKIRIIVVYNRIVAVLF